MCIIIQKANGRWSVRLDDGTTFALKEAVHNLQLVLNVH